MLLAPASPLPITPAARFVMFTCRLPTGTIGGPTSSTARSQPAVDPLLSITCLAAAPVLRSSPRTRMVASSIRWLPATTQLPGRSPTTQYRIVATKLEADLAFVHNLRGAEISAPLLLF